MAPRIQWVNLPSEDTADVKRASFVGDGVASADHMGRDVFIEAEFDSKEANAVATLVIVPDGGNAAAPVMAADKAEKAGTAKDGKVKFKITLSSAGGDKFKFKIKDKDGKEKEIPDEIETKRMLYYQVILMKGMSATEAVLCAHSEAEFLNEGRKHHIKLVKIASKGEMNGLANYDESQQGQLPVQAKASYSDAKNPYCFALLLVNQLGASGEENLISPAEVEITDPPPTIEMSTSNALWLDLDPAGTPEAKWLLSATFEETGGGKAPVILDETSISPKGAAGTKTVTIKTDKLTKGAKGKFKLKLKIVDRFRTGLSLGSNFICVATRASWKDRDDNAMKSTLVHEAGHKLGMVPSTQSTYYSNRGGHCNHNTNKCVMYGVIHSTRDNVFCATCSESVRGLNLDARTLPGFAPP
jgi:predicted secreted protein